MQIGKRGNRGGKRDQVSPVKRKCGDESLKELINFLPLKDKKRMARDQEFGGIRNDWTRKKPKHLRPSRGEDAFEERDEDQEKKR